MNEIMNISGIECYEKDGMAYLKLETVARGLGFTTVAASGNEVVRWNTVHNYLTDLGVATSCNDTNYREKCPDFIPENIFYRLAMKAKNETAEKFQAMVADEIIPSIRKHGLYATTGTMEMMLADPDMAIRLLEEIKAEREKNKVLQEENELARPKAEYFDALVARNLLTSFRETAKEFGVKEKKFIQFLIDKNYIFRNHKGKLEATAEKNNGLFEVKEFTNEKTGYASTQTLITPKGRETFRLLLEVMDI